MTSTGEGAIAMASIALLAACSVYDAVEPSNERSADGATSVAASTGWGGQDHGVASSTGTVGDGAMVPSGSGGAGVGATTGSGTFEAGTREDAGSSGSGGSGNVIVEPPADAGVGGRGLGEPEAGADVTGLEVGSTADRDAVHPVCGWGECKLVFVSSSAVTADGGSAGEFDVLCQTFARARDLPGEWRAWASYGTFAVSARMAKATVPYRLLDGSTIANDWRDLTSGALRHPIDVREDGAVSPPVEVWTGTSAAGDEVASLTCGDWTGTRGTGIVGQSDMVSYAWTFARQQYCSATGVHLYCFEQ